MAKRKYVFGNAYYSKALAMKSYYYHRGQDIEWWCKKFSAKPFQISWRRILRKAKQVTKWDLSTMNLYT